MRSEKCRQFIERMTELGFEQFFITAILSCLDTDPKLDRMLDYLTKQALFTEQEVIDHLNGIRTPADE